MAIPNTVGYLITFDSTTLIDHSTLKGASICQNGATVALRVYTLPNGTIANYDGTGDSAVTPGTVEQDIFCTTGGPDLYGTLIAKQGNYGHADIIAIDRGGFDSASNSIVSRGYFSYRKLSA